MRRLSSALVLALLLGACTDRPGQITASGGPSETSLIPVPRLEDPGVYWRTSNELMVYDKGPELGLNTHLPNYELYQTHLQQVRDANARMVRFTLYWHDVDPTGYGDAYPATNCLDCPPLHNALDNFRDNVERARRLGVVPLVVVNGLPAAHGHYGPHNNWQGATDGELLVTRQQFTRFMRDMVRLVPDVIFWQIMNEMDAGHHGIEMLGGGPFASVGYNGWFSFDRATMGRNYARLMQSVYPAIRAENPDAWVVMGGLTGTPYIDNRSNVVNHFSWEFLQGFYQQGGKRYVDFMSIHAYPWPGQPGGMNPKAAQIRGVMQQYGDAARPLWLTEFGRDAGAYIAENGVPSSNAGPVFDEDQRAYVQAGLNSLLASRTFTKAFVYNTSSSGNGAPPAGIALPQDYSCGKHPFWSAVLPGQPKQNCVPVDYSIGLFREDRITPRPAFHTIASSGINQRWSLEPYAVGDVRVVPPAGLTPSGYTFTMDGSTMIIHGVRVEKLYPTRISFARCCPEVPT